MEYESTPAIVDCLSEYFKCSISQCGFQHSIYFKNVRNCSVHKISLFVDGIRGGEVAFDVNYEEMF